MYVLPELVALDFHQTCFQPANEGYQLLQHKTVAVQLVQYSQPANEGHQLLQYKTVAVQLVQYSQPANEGHNTILLHNTVAVQ